MNIMNCEHIVKVDTTFMCYELEEYTYEYAVDTAPPMNDELYDEWKEELLKMIVADVKRNHPVEQIERIYSEIELDGKTYIAEYKD